MNKRYVSETLSGNDKDLTDAAKWFKDNNPYYNIVLEGKGFILAGKYYAMHHMPDGRSVDPILGDLHTAKEGFPGLSVSQTGAASFLNKPDFIATKGFFVNPY